MLEAVGFVDVQVLDRFDPFDGSSKEKTARHFGVEGVNRVKRHTRVGQSTRGAKTGGIVTQEAPVHVSNVMLVDPSDNKPTRVGFRREEVSKTRPDGSTYTATRSVRYSKRTGEDI